MDHHLDLDRSDKVGLAIGLTVRPDGRLVDTWLGADARPNGTALELLHRISSGRPVTLSELAGAMTDQYGLSEECAYGDARALMTKLDQNAQIEVHRPMSIWLSPAALWVDLKNLAKLQVPARPARRYPLTVGGVAAAAWRQSRLPLLVLALGSVLLTLLLLVQLPEPAPTDTAVRSGLVPLTIAAVHAALLAAHEVGHVVALRVSGSGLGLVAVRGMRMGVVYPLGATRRPRLTAAAGPVTAAIASLPMGVFGRSYGELPLEVLALAPVLGLAHLATLGRWSSDGRVIWRRHSCTATEEEAS
ncbi:MAG TPA: hypothetical protein VGR26_05980 [Acidimicrobiales bacterium]|nr:hypothetical protein [Acidimicrobiales bacterium]